MTQNERVMSPVAGRPGRAEHDVIVVGNLTVDDVVHANGETTMASPGGNTIYAATGALIWGLSVGVVARVGTDDLLRAHCVAAHQGIHRFRDLLLRETTHLRHHAGELLEVDVEGLGGMI